MPPQGHEPWQFLFSAGAALFIGLQALRGWRLGIFLQIAELISLATAYMSAYLAGPRLGPSLLRSWNMPDPVLVALGGSIAGFGVFTLLQIISSLALKRTAQKKTFGSRLKHGAAGAALGAMFGLFVVWVLTLVIRVCGALAESQVKFSDLAQPTGRAVYRLAAPAAPGWIRTVVEMKDALEAGAAGSVMKQMDPLPPVLYSVIGKIGAMLSDPQSIDRFLSYPGIRPLAQNPKILALRDDPQIVQDVKESNFVRLMHNQHLVQAANDAEVLALIRKLDVEKALDYALAGGEKPRLRIPEN